MTDQGRTGLSPLKRAFLRIEQLEAELRGRAGVSRERVAIVGMACRFPGGARTPGEFWALLREGRDATSPVPPGRWDVDAFFDPSPGTPGKCYTQRGGFLEDVDRFDAAFFGIAPREAARMDPQQRLLLEVAWEALEDAGLAPGGLSGSRTGVFVGLCTADYAALQLAQGASALDAHYASGTAHSVAAGRLSYVLGLQGPSLTVDTACSSSLVALHLACRSLEAGECDLAIAGGANVILSPETSVALCQASMLSADGRCKTFDDAADGYGRSEGCGIVILRRSTDAAAGRHRVRAIVRGSAVNQDGASSSLTAPNGGAQQAVVRSALADAGVAPVDVQYVEAHGTGTSLGDPIEIQALAAVLCERRTTEAPLVVGSVKTNIGHAEAAAGIAGVIKTVLALEHGEVPPHLHVQRPNRHVAWSTLPIVVPATATPWPTRNGRRLGGVSAFGFSGTNAHVILESAPPVTVLPAGTDRSSHVLCLSGRTETAVRTLAAQCEAALVAQPGQELADVCYTANAGRTHHDFRIALVARDRAEMVLALHGVGPTNQRPIPRRESPDQPSVAWLFTGQGAQNPGMARTLYETQPTFRATLDRCDRILRDLLPCPLLPVVFASPGSDEASRLDQTLYTQPALVVIGLGLAALWREWGVRPAAVMGHSIGELTAAIVAGVWSLEDGLALVAARARLMQSAPTGGAMCSVFASQALVEQALDASRTSVSIAAVNGPSHVVVSGRAEHVRSLVERLQAEGIRVAPLSASHAFHSADMDSILDEFEKAACAVRGAPPGIPLVSNLTGRVADPAVLATPGYWRRQLREPVRFADGIETLRQLRCTVLVEAGPAPTLLGMAARCVLGEELVLLPSLRPGQDDWRVVTESVARAYHAGLDLDWEGFDRGYSRRRVTLPTYPFERTRHWIAERAREVTRRPIGGDGHQLLGEEIRTPLAERVFATTIAPAAVPWLADHVVHGRCVLPATAHLEMVRSAAARCLGAGPMSVEDVAILALPLGAPSCAPQMVLSPLDEETWQVRVCRQADEQPGAAWIDHATARVRRLPPDQQDPAVAPPEMIRRRCSEQVDVGRFYEGLRARGLGLGPAFTSVTSLWRRDGEALGNVDLPSALDADETFPVHPVLLDGAIQIVAAAVPGFVAGDESSAIYMPVGIEAFEALGHASREVVSRAWIDASGPSSQLLRAHVDVHAPSGSIVARFRGLQLRRADSATLARAVRAEEHDWAFTLEWVSGERARGAGVPIATLASAARERWPALRAAHGTRAYDRLTPLLERLSAAYITRAVEALGWRPAAGDCTAIQALAARLEVAPRHWRLFTRLLAVLADTSSLEIEGGSVRVRTPPKGEDPAEIERQIRRECPGFEDELLIVGRCAPLLARALRGEVDPLDLLFPGGDTAVVEPLYTTAPLARACNGAMRAAVEALVGATPATRRLRVLEVGAGTGGTTSHILEALPADRTEYVFTDIGPTFVSAAARRLAEHRFIRFAPLDIASDPVAQGFEAGAYDLVIATNVLHATADVAAALAHVRRLLSPGGVLLVLEGTRPLAWLDITFGLTEGWWHFTDTQRRAYPLLGRPAWIEALAQAGFDEMSAVPDGGAAAGDSLNTLIIARAPEAGTADMDGGWLLFAHADDALAVSLSEAMEARAGEAWLVSPGSGWEEGQRRCVLDPENPDHFARVVQLASRAGGRPLRGAVYLWPPRSSTGPDAAHPGDQRVRSRGALLLLQALARHAPGHAPRLWLVTRGGLSDADGSVRLAPADAPLWGFARTARLEHPELRVVNLDLDEASASDASSVLEELLGTGDDDQVAYRDTKRLLLRLTRAGGPAAPRPPAAATHPRAFVEVPGDLRSIRVVDVPGRRPGAGEVEVRVRAAGLNFRDVLNAIGMRQDAESLGGEFAGEVVSVGPGVTTLGPGDAVMGLARGSLAGRTIARATHTTRVFKALDWERAASVPIAFATAHYALRCVGQIRSGERVLVHAAAGGVGLAALQVARRAGADVFATSGTPEKREYLRQCGVRHVMDSRNTRFADEIRAATFGEGVDVVIGAVTGDVRRASAALLRAGGRFLDVGHDEPWTSDLLGLLDACGATCHVIDLSSRISEEPDLMMRLFAELEPAFEAGEHAPLPLETFPLDHVADAFEHMARARHVGKVILVPDVRADDAGDRRPWLPTPAATYLVTGGASGLGLELARWLVGLGARHLVLVNRRPPGASAMRVFDGLRARGASVTCAQADVADETAMRAILDAIPGAAPLRGVFHLAGVLDDGVLMQQSWDRFARVFRPKVDGSWLLHRLTRDLPIDEFVLFSSVSAIFGSAAQANHGAANAFLDALATHRRSQGLPARSINWGIWSEVGAAAARGADTRTALLGILPFDPSSGMRMLEQIMAAGAVQVVAAPLDVPALVEASGSARRQLVAALGAESRAVGHASRRPCASGSASAAVATRARASATLADRLRAALPARRGVILRGALREEAARVLGLRGAAIDRRTPLNELGLDSLMAVELRNALASALGHPLPATVLFDYPTLDALANYLEAHVLGLGPAQVSPQVSSSPPTGRTLDLLDRLEALPDDDVRGLLEEERS